MQNQKKQKRKRGLKKKKPITAHFQQILRSIPFPPTFIHDSSSTKRKIKPKYTKIITSKSQIPQNP